MDRVTTWRVAVERSRQEAEVYMERYLEAMERSGHYAMKLATAVERVEQDHLMAQQGMEYDEYVRIREQNGL